MTIRSAIVKPKLSSNPHAAVTHAQGKDGRVVLIHPGCSAKEGADGRKVEYRKVVRQGGALMAEWSQFRLAGMDVKAKMAGLSQFLKGADRLKARMVE